MKIENKAGPAVPFVDKPGGQSDISKQNRAKAIEVFNRGSASVQAAQSSAPNSIQPNTTVQNASSVSPEEMAGIRASVADNTEQLPQNHTSDTQEATSPPKVEEPPLSPQYALLARKEKALRAEVQKLNAAKAAFKAEQEAGKSSVQVAPPAPAIDESKFIPKDRLTQDFIGVLEELGYSSEDIAQRLLTRQPVDPAQAAYMAKLEAKIAKLEASQDETKKTFETSQTDSYNQAVTAMEYEAEELVNTDPEFATIKETGQHKEIVNLIKDVHEKGLPGKFRKGTLLSVDQAARLVEDELVNQWIEQHEKLSRLDKIQKRLKSATQSAKPGNSQGTQAQNQPATQNTTKTLTNSIGAAGNMSARERAIAVFNGTLKQ